jgi:hypothetical protein
VDQASPTNVDNFFAETEQVAFCVHTSRLLVIEGNSAKASVLKEGKEMGADRKLLHSQSRPLKRSRLTFCAQLSTSYQETWRE